MTARRIFSWETLRDVLITLVGVVIGVALAEGLAYYHGTVQLREHDKAVLRAVRDDASANVMLLQNNLKLLRDSKRPLEPLSLPVPVYWDLLRISPPAELAPSTLRAFRVSAIQLNQLAEAIRTRENYRVFNAAATTYSSTLSGYDALLLERHTVALQTLNDAINDVGTIRNSSATGADGATK